jgi:uncharacterized protein
MFHFYLLLVYTIPNIYVFFRIMFLFIGKRYRLLYTVIYLLLAAVYPVAENLSHLGPGSLMQLLTTVGDYLLPFYLYVFLLVLLYDLFLLLNTLLRLVPKEVRRSFTYRFYTLSSIIVLSVAVVVGGIINLNTIRASRYQIAVPKRNSQLSNLRVAFVADFHIHQHSNPGYVEQFVRKVNALKPDIMLYGGDIVEGRDENRIADEILSALRNVQSKYGAFGVLGNHESYGSRGNGTFYEKAGITLLRDTILNIDNSFYLAGRDDERFRDRKSAEEILQNGTSGMPIILLDHRPTRLQEISLTPVNVQFSGHTHNGQLIPINFIIGSMYELAWGHKKIRDTHFFVTSGLRLWGPPVKTAGKSEIMVVDMRFE